MAEEDASAKRIRWITNALIVFGTIILTGVWLMFGASGPFIGRFIHEWGMFFIFGPGGLGALIFLIVTPILIYELRAYSLSRSFSRPWIVTLVGLGLWFILSCFVAEVATFIFYSSLCAARVRPPSKSSPSGPPSVPALCLIRSVRPMQYWDNAKAHKMLGATQLHWSRRKIQ